MARWNPHVADYYINVFFRLRRDVGFMVSLLSDYYYL